MAEYQWVGLGYGRKRLRKVREPQRVARSDFATPMIISDFAEPVQSMADGRWYTSKRGLAASHRAGGNPSGQEFVELGNEPCPFVEHKTDEAQLRRDVREAVEDVKAGRRASVLSLDI